MKTDSIVLEWRNDSFTRTTNLANLIADELKLSAENRNNLIMLSEETLSMEKSILGTTIGELYYELDGLCCTLIISANIELNDELKAALIRMSSTGVNEYKSTLRDKLHSFIKNTLSDNDISALLDDTDDTDGSELVIETTDGEVWDESERAILHHIADEIRVAIKNKSLIIKVTKDFS